MDSLVPWGDDRSQSGLDDEIVKLVMQRGAGHAGVQPRCLLWLAGIVRPALGGDSHINVGWANRISLDAARAACRPSAEGYVLCVGVTGAEMAERLTSWAWWTGERQPYSKLGRPIGGNFLGATRGGEGENVFTWKYGRADVTLTWEGDHWRVAHAADGRLLGPRQTLYEARHRRSDIAVWDVMARVIQVCRDEAVGLDIARQAARWMRGRGLPAGES